MVVNFPVEVHGLGQQICTSYIGRRLMAPTAERMRIRLAVFDGKQRWWLVGHQDAKLVTCRSINGFDMVTGQARFQEGDRIRFRRSADLLRVFTASCHF